ncbi:MAG: hypothetical protein ICV64_00405 [Thermoleophilia bacterium]|nr:hypothetical protein [Thermoleophilia bacterium]
MQYVSRYPLRGIREATTDRQLALLDTAAAVLRDDDRVLAAWLAGSLAVGRGDPFSDVDVHCCVEDSAAAELSGEGWKEILGRITPTVMAVAFPPPSIGGYSLTPDWVHVDLLFQPRSGFEPAKLDGYRRLFDKTGELVLQAESPAAPIEGERYFPAATVEWFFYMFGKLVAVVGRNEPVLGMLGAVTIRDTCLVPLFCAERGVRRGGGAKRLRPFLSAEQHALLEGLPPFAPTLDSVIDSELALAQIFVPRGRALAAATGAHWPGALETATVRHVERAIGVPVVIPEHAP